MKSTFSFRRFWLLVKRHGHENVKLYLLGWGAIAFLILLITVLFGYKGSPLIGMFPIIFCFTGALITITLFSHWPDLGRSSLYLMLPATTTEKYLTALFYCLVLFIPLFIILYFVTGFIFVKISWSSATLAEFLQSIRMLYSARLFLDLLIAFLLMQSLTMVGVIFFRRKQFLVSILILVLIFLFYTLTSYVIVKSLTDVTVSTWLIPFYNYGFGFAANNGTKLSFEYYHFKGLINHLYPFIWIIAAALIYLCGWFKLREREL